MQFNRIYASSDYHDSKAFPMISGPVIGKDQQIREMVSGDRALQKKFGAPVLDTQAIDRMEQEIKQYRNLDFERWAQNKMDLSTPYKAKFWLDKTPELFEKKNEFIKQNGELQKRLAKITMFGPENLDDMRLIYDLQQDQVQVWDAPLYKTVPPEGTNLLHSFINKLNLFPSSYSEANEQKFNILGRKESVYPIPTSVFPYNSNTSERSNALIDSLGMFKYSF